MVKSDVRRDYYADLGLTPHAESEDIKKQFRKLALKFHPDRNPGRELEFNSKFQAIQAANEILSDPQQRLRYDTDRLRAGYGKFYGPSKSNTPRKPAANNYTPTSSAKPQNQKQQFSGRPQSFQNGPSAGAQRYASYARAAPKQPWEKMPDEGQTRADAYRGFQDMKGNGTPGWNQFDPRTGRSGYAGSSPRPNATSGGPRPRSAYEYFKSPPKPTASESARASSAKKKQGFAPRAAAGGDEPMASSTSSYTNARGERTHTTEQFGAAPSPTARKAAAGFGRRADTRTPDIERTRSQYASTGGERTFFSSAGLGHSSSLRDPPESPTPYSRTNPSSPTPSDTGRHRSASPKFKTDSNRNYSSTSSSDVDDDVHPAHKPKAVPKSRLRPHEKFSGFHAQQQWAAGNGHDSDSAASPRNAFGAKAQNPFEPAQASESTSRNGTFKSSSHDDLRKPFSANNWGGFDFFTPVSSDKEQPQPAQRPDSRGRTSTRNSPDRAGGSAGASIPDPSRPDSSASKQPPTPFAKANFHADEWQDKFRDMQWALPNDDELPKPSQQAANSQRQRSPRKPTRPAAKLRPDPQAASVATEAEEAKATADGENTQEPAGTGASNGEAMDLDDDLPTKTTSPATAEPTAAKDSENKNPRPESRPPSTEGSKKGDNAKSKRFDMKDLGDTAPFTHTGNGGIEDLQDIHATLPFESRAKTPRTTIRDIRPRELVCPNPPKRPQPPQLVPVNAGSQQQALPRAAWERYVSEMNIYMREWNAFDRRVLRHFNARQEALETGMAPNWIGAVGDSARLKVDEPNDPEDAQDEDKGADIMVAGSGKGGYSAYLRGLDEDTKVQKHWEVAREMHRECILQLGQMREWILNGGKLI